MSGRDGNAWGHSGRDIEAAGRESAGQLLTSLRARGREVAGRYRIEDLLGAGSSGIVLSARHVYLGQPVALKILRCTTVAGARAQRRKLRERYLAATLASRHVVRTLDAGFTAEGAPFLVTERLTGETLAEVLARRGPLPCAEAVRWVLQACEALAEAHARGLVHADLKPQNLFLERDLEREDSAVEQADAERSLKILDFGMVTPLEEAVDDHGTTWFSSPAYFSPEQIEQPEAVDARTDIWALGVILYELLTGAPPFRADSVAGVLVAVTTEEPPPLPDHVPAPLASLVRTCLDKDPRSRPSNVRNLAMALAPYAEAVGPALAAEVESAASRGLEAAAPSPLPLAVPPPPPAAEARPRAPMPARTPTTSRSATTRPSRRINDAAHRRSRRAFLLAAAVLLAAAATLAMPSNQLTPRALRDLARRPPILEAARDIIDPPEPLEPSEMAVDSGGAPAPAPEPSRPEPRSEAALPPPVVPKARARGAAGFTHPSQLH